MFKTCIATDTEFCFITCWGLKY